MANKKLKRRKMDEYNRERRAKRRIWAPHTDDDLTIFKDRPTPQELKDALRNISAGHLAIIRLAALMDNLSMHEARRVSSSTEGDCRGKTQGIKEYLRQDGYLYSRYSSLMRYKKLGKLLRERSGIGIDINLLWGLDPSLPRVDGEVLSWYEDDWQKLHDLYTSLEGMNFKQINEKLKGETT